MVLMNEFERIAAFLEAFSLRSPPAGPGDDAAVLPPTKHQQVVTTDAVVEGVHFTRESFRLADVGYKALAVNLSDVAAMGARPSWALCALQLPPDFSDKHLRALSSGMAALAAAHGVSLIGGNVTKAQHLSVTVTLAGEVPRGARAMTRSGARPGHRVYVSGPLGSASAGLEVLAAARREASSRFPLKFDPQWEALVAAQRSPAPHVRWGVEAARFASACIDVSDGLVQDLGHVCEASGVGMALETGALPVLEALLRWCASEKHVHRHALTGGEDYVLAVTVPASRTREFEKRLATVGYGAFPIGVVTRDAGLTIDGRQLRGPGGYQHFR
jgi:thiamine-monophosphate kinase